MENTAKFLKDNNVVPFISFKDKKVHTVELLKDKMETITDAQGETKEGVKYLVKEGGTVKSFFTTSISLLQQLADKQKGDVVSIQLKSKKGEDGKYKSYYEVWEDLANDSSDDEEEIPIIDDDLYEGDTPFS